MKPEKKNKGIFRGFWLDSETNKQLSALMELLRRNGVSDTLRILIQDRHKEVFYNADYNAEKN